MRLILTRPASDNEALARKLSEHGHEAIRAPLLSIVPRRDIDLPMRRYQAIVFSSANAAKAIAKHARVEQLVATPAYAVGEQSAHAVRQTGFRDVRAAGDSAAGLAEFLIGRLRGADGPILYLSGADVTGDLAGRLSKAGFPVTRTILYDAVAAERLPNAADAVLRDGKNGGVLLYSPRTAVIWRTLVARAGLAPGPLVHYCLSANVAAALGSSYKAEVAERPTEVSLLECLGIITEGGS
jgi:uroporphyrinogen-III synthase